MIKLTKEQANDLEDLLYKYQDYMSKDILVKDIVCDETGGKSDYPFLFELSNLDIVNVVLNGYELKKEPHEIVNDYIDFLGEELNENCNNDSLSSHIRSKIDGAKELAKRLDINRYKNNEE